jgi:hypothetical protein
MIVPEVYNAYNKWASMVVGQAKANLLRGKKDATKKLSNSIVYEIVSDPNGDFGAGVNFYYLDYGDFVESGRRAGARMPPPSKLVFWAKIKGLPQFRDKKGRFISNESRAFLIARSIGKKGIKPFPFITDVVEQSENDLLYILEEALADAITHDMEALSELKGL